MSSLLDDEDVVTVQPHASADEVAGQLVEARRLSLVVVDDDGRPIGRILADDVLDALVPTKGRFHFPKLLDVRAPVSPAGAGLPGRGRARGYRGRGRQRCRRRRHVLVGRARSSSTARSSSWC